MSSTNVQDSVVIDWVRIRSEKFLRFKFTGHLTNDSAIPAIAEWQKHIRSLNGAEIKTPIIWDCLEMKDFEKSAAMLWKKALAELSDKTGTIWLVSKNPLIKLGAGMVTLVSGIKLRNVRSESEIRNQI